MALPVYFKLEMVTVLCVGWMGTEKKNNTILKGEKNKVNGTKLNVPMWIGDLDLISFINYS